MDEIKYYGNGYKQCNNCVHTGKQLSDAPCIRCSIFFVQLSKTNSNYKDYWEPAKFRVRFKVE